MICWCIAGVFRISSYRGFVSVADTIAIRVVGAIIIGSVALIGYAISVRIVGVGFECVDGAIAVAVGGSFCPIIDAVAVSIGVIWISAVGGFVGIADAVTVTVWVRTVWNKVAI